MKTCRHLAYIATGRDPQFPYAICCRRCNTVFDAATHRKDAQLMVDDINAGRAA